MRVGIIKVSIGGMTGSNCFGWFQECKKAKTQFSMTVFKLVAGFDLCLPVSSPLFYVRFMMLGSFLKGIQTR